MLHIYIPESIHIDEYVIADKDRLHHLSIVCRARCGDAVSLFDPVGNAYHGAISRITKTELVVKIEKRETTRPSKIHLTVACALPKGSGLDEIIDSLTQLGVDTLIPMLTERVIARPEDPAKKLERWQKIALNAAEQSQRNSLPEITPVMTLEEVIRRTTPFDLKLIPTLEGQTRPLNQVLRNFRSGKIVVLIGPEGDFTPDEVQIALQAGFSGISLGNNVLRVNTAAAAVSAMIKLAFPD